MLNRLVLRPIFCTTPYLWKGREIDLNVEWDGLIRLLSNCRPSVHLNALHQGWQGDQIGIVLCRQALITSKLASSSCECPFKKVSCFVIFACSAARAGSKGCWAWSEVLSSRPLLGLKQVSAWLFRCRPCSQAWLIRLAWQWGSWQESLASHCEENSQVTKIAFCVGNMTWSMVFCSTSKL